YILAREYIRLALTGPGTYQAILAVTFTNKATQEMKDRIINFLDKLRKGEEPVLAAYMMKELDINEPLLMARAESTLSDILHGFARFNVSTIDSFFQKVIRAFARDIGLQSGFKVELDKDKVLSELADRVMADVGPKKGLTKWLVQFAREKVEDSKSWDLRTNIMELGREIFRENYKQIEPGLQEASEKGFLTGLRKDLSAQKKKFENDMQACGRKAIGIMEQSGLGVDDFSYKKSGVAGYLLALADGTISSKTNGFIPGKRVQDALEDPEKWTSKSSKRREEIIAIVERELRPSLQEAFDCFTRDYALYVTTSEALRYFYTFGILTDLTAKLKDYREEEGVMLISDAAPFLNQVIGGNDSPFVYEKVGAYIRHYLVDEFQDTSQMQWQNLHPLILDTISQGMLSMVVGDIKQSIYRWRGGDWRLLLDGLTQHFSGMHEERRLDRNYRSSQEIIQFNNALFTLVPEILKSKLAGEVSDSTDSESAEYFEKVYKYASQENPHGKKAGTGYVQVTFLQDKDEAYGEQDEANATWKDEVLRRLPGDIEKLQDSGYAAGDIAILTRTARDGKQIADRLLAYKSGTEARKDINYEVVSSESLYVEAAYSVHILLQAFRHLHNREDTVALANLLHDYNRYVRKDFSIPISDLLRPRKPDDGSIAAVLPSRFWHHRDTIARLPLYELSERLIEAFSLQNMTEEFPYIQSFQDLVLEFSREQRADIGGFLEWWAEKGYSSTVPMPENINAIRILTIHKSKGLQFPVVMIPFCDWELDHGRSTNILWCSTAGLPEPFSRTPFLPIRYNSNLAYSYFAGEYLEEMSRAYLDNLNLLYVALTRPESAMIVYSHSARPEGKSPKLKTAGHLLHQAVAHTPLEHANEEFFLKMHYSEEEEVFTYGSLDRNREADLKEEAEKKPTLNRYPVTVDIGSRVIIRPRSPYRPGRPETDSDEARSRGTVIHEILAGMDTWQDKSRSLRQTAFRFGITDSEKKDYDDLLNQLGEMPEMQDWFGEGYEVKREAELVTPGGKVYRPDRVIRKDRSITVLDFKTGSEESQHHAQIQGYMSQIEAMGYENISGWLVYVDIQKVVSVEQSGQMQIF
ncbi:MAG: UvrD-helicase domain-containing protein, partial [Cyclobacteriaceae bacterium]